MIRFHCRVLIHLVSSPSVSSLHHLLSTAAPAAPRISPNPSFAVEEYLVATYGLTRPQAIKASQKLSHLKSPTNPDAVLAFLASLGLSGAEVAAVIAKDPRLLCASVERILAPNVAALTGVGLPRSDIARFLSLGRPQSRCTAVVSTLQYYLHLFGSFDNLLWALKYGSLLSSDLECVVKPNVTFLQECGLGDCEIAKLCIHAPRMLSAEPECVVAMVACAEGIGVPRGSGMFRQALQAVAFLSVEKIAARVEYLKSTFRWSDAEVGIAVCKAPTVLARTKESLQRRSEFLISEVGLEPAYIAYRSSMLTYSLEGRIRPRYYVVKFLKENGLLKRDPSYFTVFKESEKAFKKKFIHPHKEAAPNLGKDYDAACKGEVPTNFSFT